MDCTSEAKPTMRWELVGPRAMVTFAVEGDLVSGVDVLEWTSGGVEDGEGVGLDGRRVTVMYS